MPIDEKQITNKQHAVPQNIMDVDFKIIGDLTLREFIYLLVFFGLAYWAFMTINFVIKWPIILFFVLTGVIFARGRFGERGVDEWVVNFFRAIYNPTQKIWKKSPIIPTAFSYKNLDFVKNELITLAPTATRRKLENYLESYNTTAIAKETYEQKEEDYIRKIHEYSYSTAATLAGENTIGSGTNTQVSTAVIDSVQSPPVQQQEEKLPEAEKPKASVEEKPAQEKPTISFDIKSMYHKIKPGQPKVNTPAVPQMPVQPLPKQTQVDAPAINVPQVTPVSTPVVTPVAEPKQVTVNTVAQPPQEKLPELSQFKDLHKSAGMQKIITQMKQSQHEYAEEPVQTKPEQPLPKQQQTSHQAPQPFMPKKASAEAIKPSQTLEPFQMPTPIVEIQKPVEKEVKPATTYTPTTEPIMPSITPDRVAGRRFTQLAMDKQGTIILPIRGEKVLRAESIDETVAQKQLQEKTQQLQVLLEQIRRESGIASATINAPIQQPTQQTTQAPQTQAQKDEEVLQKLKSENQRLIDEIGHLKGEMAKTQALGNLQQQEQVLQSASIEQEVLRKQIEDLQTKITQKDVETQALRKRELQRVEEERKQAETLRLMMQMQAEKDRKEQDHKKQEETERLQKEEHAKAEAQELEKKLQQEAQAKKQAEEKEHQLALAKQKEEERIKLEQERKKQEEIKRVQEEERIKAEAAKEAARKVEEAKRAEEVKKAEVERLKAEEARKADEAKREAEARKQAEAHELEKKRQQEAEAKKLQEEHRLKEVEIQNNKELQRAKEQEIQKKQQAEEEQKRAREQKEASARALKEAEARAYEEQKRAEAAKQRTEEERKKQEEAIKTSTRATIPAFAKIQPITTMPNAVSGIVKNKEGKTLEGILVIIKRENGEPVRALKTNILGQFAITTPLSNGVYILEIDKSGSTNEKFDIIKVTAEGKTIPPIDFTGH